MKGVIILAAGASLRMGQAKQQLPFKGKTLLSHSIDAAVDSPADKVVVVLGANLEKIAPGPLHQKVQLVINKEWSEGMSSSLKAGLWSLLASDNEMESVLVMLCDQPFVDSALLGALFALKSKSGAPVVACDYGPITGPPAVFDKALFPDLLKLHGTAGAKKIIHQFDSFVEKYYFPAGKIDIDTPEDYKDLPG